jgi:hypothetical protein
VKGERRDTYLALVCRLTVENLEKKNKIDKTGVSASTLTFYLSMLPIKVTVLSQSSFFSCMTLFALQQSGVR